MKRLLAMLPLLLSSAATADTVMIPAAKDNTLYDETLGGLSNGAGDSFFTGLTGEPRVTRGLIEFDVAASVPAGSTITDATLTLYMAQASVLNPFVPHTVGVHRALAEWGEGTSHAASGEGGGIAPTAGDATWIHTVFPGTFWTSAGGDYDATATATLLVPVTPGFNSWNSAQLAADAQLFLDVPTDNHGWILVGTETSNARRFESRTGPTPANQPLLTVEFTPPPVAAPSLSATALGLLALMTGAAGVVAAKRSS